MMFALMACHWILGPKFVVTSVSEGKHKRKSKHYTGYGMDVRTRNLDNPKSMRDSIAAVLGKDFDVILEKDHIHIEFEPPEAY